MYVNAGHEWQQSGTNINNNNSNRRSQAQRGTPSDQTIVFSQKLGMARSSVPSYQRHEARLHNSNKHHNAGARHSKSVDYNQHQSTFRHQWQNNQGQTFAVQSSPNQQAGCKINQQVIQYNFNVGNLPEPQMHVNQSVGVQQQPHQQQPQQQQHDQHSITPLQVQQSRMPKGQLSGAYNSNMSTQNTQQYVGGVRRTLADVQQGSLSTQQYFRTSSADYSLENYSNLNQHITPGAYKSNAQSHAEAGKCNNLTSKTPAPFVKVAKRQTTANRKVQLQRLSPPNQQYTISHYPLAVPTQNQQTIHQHTAIPTPNQQQPSAYPTIATPFEQLPHQYPTIPTQSQTQLQSPEQQLFIELQHHQNQPRSTPQQSQQTERDSPQLNQRFSPPNQRVSPQMQRASPQAPNPPPQSSPQLQQPSLGVHPTHVLSSDSDMRSTTTSGDYPCDLTLDGLIKEVDSLNKTRINLEDSKQTSINQLSPFNQKKLPNNEIPSDIQMGNYFSLQGNVDSNRCNRSTSQEAAAKTTRPKEKLPPHPPGLESQNAADATFLRWCSTTTNERRGDNLVLPRIVGHFVGKNISEMRSRDYVMYALSDDSRVAETAIATQSHEPTKMFVCVEFPPRSPWTGGAREAKKAYYLVKNACDVSRIVAYYRCTTVRMVLGICRLSQNAERRVQQTTQVPEVERKSPILSGLQQPSSISEPPSELASVFPAISSANTPPTRPSPSNQQNKSPPLENTAEQASPAKQQRSNTIQENIAEKTAEQAPLRPPVKQTPPSCSIESEEEKMTRIRKEVEALLNAGKPDLRKVAAKRSRGDPELPTLDRFRRKRKSREIDADSKRVRSDVTIRNETPPTAKLQDHVEESVLSATEKCQSSSATINDDVISQHADVTADNVIVEMERDEIDHMHRDTEVNRDDVKSGHDNVRTDHDDVGTEQDDVETEHDDVRTEHEWAGADKNDVKSENDDVGAEQDDVETGHDDVGVEQDDVRSEHDWVGVDKHNVRSENDDVGVEHDDVKAGRDKKNVAFAMRASPKKAALNCEKAAKRSEDAENTNLRKRKRASMRAGSCRAPRLDLVYRSYLDSLEPSPIVPRKCAPRDVTIIPCSIRISDVFSLNKVA